jgi:hypothetical protein
MMLRAGDWVEVRSKEEILATLDTDGRLEKLPFMPQLFQYCGQRFQVTKRADKTCDTVTGRYVGRRMENTVHLEHRCDGRAYGGCQAGCLIFWKEAWLKPIGKETAPEADADVHLTNRADACTEDHVVQATRVHQPGDKVRYSCQATRLLEYTSPLKWWDARQYVQAYRSGNVSLSELLRGLAYLFYFYGTRAGSERFGKPSRWLYDRFQTIWGGLPFPRRTGSIPVGQLTPRRDLGLRPGELVRMKSYEDILATLDKASSNRGLNFDAEFVPYCGRTFRVQRQVERFVDEKTGLMRTLKTPAVILDGVYCKSLFAGQRMFCPRGIYLWCREIWLERVSESAVTETAQMPEGACHASLTTALGAAPQLGTSPIVRNGQSQSEPAPSLWADATHTHATGAGPVPGLDTSP